MTTRRLQGVDAAFARRSRCLQALLLGGLGLVLARVAELQILQHGRLSRLSREQYLGTVKVPARRGDITDRHGNALAISLDVPSVFANPGGIPEPRGSARLLARVLGMDASVLLGRLRSGKYFVWLKRQVTPAVADKVRALHMTGVGLTREPRRFYPQREVGAHVVGFAGVDARGLEGIEKSLDAELLGAPQVVPAWRDARGQAVLAGDLDPGQRARGSDVRLSLDLQLQHAAQAAVDGARRAHRATGATAVVLDVGTAEVLAMAVSPPFNPNEAGRLPPALRRNRLVTDMFEPGSTLKPWVVGLALDSGAIGPDSTFFCENGRYRVGGHWISDTSPHGRLGLTEIVARSSNIGMAKIAQALGRHRLDAGLRRAHVATRTGIELPGEAPGSLMPAARWGELETATIAFGQGMAVNGMQLAALYRALAAGGLWREPRLVSRITRADGQDVGLAAAPEERLLRPATARRLMHMLEASVAPHGGTGRLAAVPGYRVAGKTGTAQKADPVGGGYSRDRYVALFAGFLPLPAPRAVIVVAVDEPQTSHYGGAVAAPVFAEIGLAAMQRLGVPPQDDAPSSPLPSPSAGRAVAAAPTAGEAVEAEAAVVDAAEPRPGTVPSFVGLSGRQAVQRLAQADLPYALQLRGSGRVASQWPAAGSPRRSRGQLQLVLQP